MLTRHGLKNRHPCHMARKWLEAEGIGHGFVDVRQEPPAADMIAKWIDDLGAEALIGDRLALLELSLIDVGGPLLRRHRAMAGEWRPPS